MNGKKQKELKKKLEDVVSMISDAYAVDKSVAWKEIESIAFWENIKHDGEEDAETKK